MNFPTGPSTTFFVTHDQTSTMMHKETTVVEVPRGTPIDEGFLTSFYGTAVMVLGNIGEGAYSTVVECRLSDGTRLALKIMKTEVFTTAQPTRQEIEIFMRTGKGQGDWIDEIDEFLKELSYARFMAREGIGPRVHASTLVLEKNRYRPHHIRSAAVILAMEMLLPLGKNDMIKETEPDMLVLLRRMANRKVVCLDIKPAHFMRTRRGGVLKCIDFGSYWCRRALPGTPVGGKISRDAMVILMAAQMFLHSIKYGKRAIFGSWLQHAMQTQPRAWEAARDVYTHQFVDPIPTTYFSMSGRDIWDSLSNLLRNTEMTRDGRFVASHGIPMSHLQVRLLIMGDD